MSSPREQVAKALEPLVDQPIARRLLSEASAWRHRTIRAQEVTLAALNLPTGADLAKLERRLRSLTEGMVRLEDHLDRVEALVRHTDGNAAALEQLRAEVEALRKQITQD